MTPDQTVAQNTNAPDAVTVSWRMLTSTGLAVTLILLLALAVLAGALLAQAPSAAQASPMAYAAFLERAREKYGVWTDLLSELSLFKVYGSLWFRALVLLLMANVVVCTANRFPRLWRLTFSPSVTMSEEAMARAAHSVSLTLASSPASVAQLARLALGARRYRVRVEEREEAVSIYADQNHLARLGTVLNHAGLVLILVGVLVGSLFGFRDEEVVIPEGKAHQVGYGTNLVVGLEKFIDEYYPDGTPKDYYSDLVLWRGEQEVARQRLRVNDPLSYDGVSFYQSFFGNAVALRVRDEAGQVLYDDVVPLSYSYGGNSLGTFDLPSREMSVLAMWTAGAAPDAPDLFIHGYMTATQKAAFAGPLNQGPDGRAKLGGLEFEFYEVRRFTGLQIASDPGLPIIWASCTMMILGTAMAFYFPHRRLWLRCVAEGDETGLMVAGAGERDAGLAHEVRSVVDEIARAGSPSTRRENG